MLSRFHIALRHLAVGLAVLFSGLSAPEALAQNPNWSINPPDFEQSMNVVGVLTINGTASANSNDQVAAFVGTEIRGVASPLDVSGTQYFFLTVYANGGTETITFKAYDATNDRVLDITETVTFVANGVEGTLGTPFTWAATGSQVAKPAVPVLKTPTDGATNQALGVPLTWDVAQRATSYDLEIATTVTFDTPLVSETGLTTTQFTPTSLSATTTYFWRVRAVGAGGASAWSNPFSFTTGAATRPTLVAPADSARNQATTITFLWSAVPNTVSYDFQIATDNAFINLVADVTGLMAATRDQAGFSAGATYHWRVRAVGAGGAGAWSKPFIFTTRPLAPQVPTILAPNNQAQNIPRSVRLLWNPAERATQYDVQVATDEAFTTLVADEDSLTTTFYDVADLDLATTYFWRVRGRNEGGISAWATPFSFGTQRGSIPANPVLLTPVDAAQLTTTTVDFIWRSNRASSYTIQISPESDFSTIPVQSAGLTDTTFTATGLTEGATYFWRVQASDGASSSIFSLSLVRPGLQVSVPELQSPANNSTDLPLEVQLAWGAASNATTYDVQVSESSTFAATFVNETGITGIRLDVRNLASETTYFWRVRGRNGEAASNWSTSFQWTTKAAVALPNAPTLLLPRDGLVSGETGLMLSWRASGASSRYHVQVATQLHFGDLVVDDEDVDATEYQLSNLSRGTDYFWRVRSIGEGGFSAWSDIFQFRVAELELPDPPALVAPADGAENVAASFELQWEIVLGVTSYEVQIATTSDFARPIFRREGVRTTRQAVTNLALNDTYFWRVRSRTAVGAGEWSAPFSFNTNVVSVLSAPSLTAPAHNATDRPLDVRLVWSVVSQTTHYDVHIATDASYQNLVLSETNVASTFLDASNLTHGTTYFWRVRSRTSDEESAWSS